MICRRTPQQQLQQVHKKIGFCELEGCKTIPSACARWMICMASSNVIMRPLPFCTVLRAAPSNDRQLSIGLPQPLSKSSRSCRQTQLRTAISVLARRIASTCI